MELKKLQVKPGYNNDKKLLLKLATFQQLITELEKRALPLSLQDSINLDIEEINTFTGTEKELIKLLDKKQVRIVQQVEKECKLVPKNHYRKLWLVLGMSAFGLPLGVVFGLSMGNIGLMAIGLPIGMGIGVAVGTAMDNKARAAGKQLEVELT